MHPVRSPLLSVFLACAMLLSGCASMAGQPAGALFARHVPADYSGVAAVRRDRSAPLHVHASGLASREQGRAHADDTRFMVGSVTKWVSAVTVLRLVDQGRLDLDAPIARQLPELPAENGAVTLRQLLSNRSGVPNGVSQALRQDPSVATLEIGPVAGAARFGAGPMAATPGTQWDYSVTNWVLVAAVVERATGQRFPDVVQELVLAPAGVQHTSFIAAGGQEGAAMAIAYGTAGARKLSPAPPMVAASGTLYSTARDLVALADTVYFTQLLSDQSRRELMTVHVAAEDYALGGRVRTIATKEGARSLAWESGTSGGYKSLLAYDPASGRAVVLLNNTDMQQSAQADIAIALLGAM